MYNSLNRDIEYFGDIYDRRTNEYDNCEGVGEVIKKIRNNDNTWQSDSSLVKQVPCIPVYKWDGKFYKDEASAKAGSTSEEVMSPSDSGTLTNSTDEKHPGEYVHKKGKFTMSSIWNDSWATNIAINSNGIGWLSRSDRYTTDDNWLQMETVSGDIEMIKGVVTKGRHDTYKYYVKKFKVFVSRNGDSWKQVRDINNNEEFTGHNDSNYTKKKENYFNQVVEAKYIRVYPTDHKTYPALRLGYIKDKSGTVNCTGGSGMFNGTPWFRFTFDEAKTRSKSTYSEGTKYIDNICPTNGKVMVRQRGKITIGDNNIPVGNLKIIDGGIVKGLTGVMGNKTIRSCGPDPTSKGWFSSETYASPKNWSACKIPDDKGLLGTEDSYHTEHGGFRYMYRHWGPESNNNSIYDTGDGYNKWPDSDPPYKDNTQSSNANDGSTYSVPSTNIKLNDYEKVNIIRQPCNRGVKGEAPILGTEWESSIPSSSNGQVGYKGKIWNLTGGIEGWINSKFKDTWGNYFNNKIKKIKKIEESPGDEKGPHTYKVVEIEGTNDNTRGTNSHTWSDGSKGYGGHIDGNKAYHSTGYSASNWKTSLDDEKACAKYKNDTKFYAVGIKVQPRSGYYTTQAPTKLRLSFATDTIDVTLGEFKNDDDIKTILIDPLHRKLTNKFYVYSRHGRDSTAVSFRINFIIGKPGEGYSIDKGSSVVNGNDEPVDCTIGAWSDWSACGAPCGGGKKTKTRAISAASHGGKNDCSGDTTDDQDCNTHECPEARELRLAKERQAAKALKAAQLKAAQIMLMARMGFR